MIITTIIGSAPVSNFHGFHLHYKILHIHLCVLLINLKNYPSVSDNILVICLNHVDQSDIYLGEIYIVISLPVLLIPHTGLELPRNRAWYCLMHQHSNRASGTVGAELRLVEVRVASEMSLLCCVRKRR